MKCPTCNVIFTRDPGDGRWRKAPDEGRCWSGSFTDEQAQSVAQNHPTHLVIEPGDFPEPKESNNGN